MYFNIIENNRNMDKSICAVIEGMLSFKNYMKLQNSIHNRREDAADPSTLPILPSLPISLIT
jgi:hypothetical protein